MSGSAFSLSWAVTVLAGAALGLCVFLTALAIKLVDDAVDEPEAVARGAGLPRFAAYLGLLFAISAVLAPGAMASLFLCAYAVGMADRPGSRQPTGLPGWVESFLAVGLAVALTGAQEAAGSLLLVTGAQALDDFLDLPADLEAGRGSLARSLGRGPCMVLAVILGGAAWVLAPVKASAGVLAAVFISGAGARKVAAGGNSVDALEAGASRPPGERWASGALGRRAGLPGGAVRRATLAGLVCAAAGALAGGLTPAAGASWAWVAGYVGPGAGPSPGTSGGASAMAGDLWVYLVGAILAALVLTAGTVAAYRRGMIEGKRRGQAAGRALRTLEERAARLDDHET